jgi:hypothetical protein
MRGAFHAVRPIAGAFDCMPKWPRVMMHVPVYRPATAAACFIGCLFMWYGCSKDTSSGPEKPMLPPSPLCEKTDTLRIDNSTPTVTVADWGPPFRLGEPVNTLCPQDAIEITRDGAYLYVMYTEDVLDKMSPEQILARHNNTYRLKRIGGPDEFGEPEYYDLGAGTSQSFNGELSFSLDGGTMYYASGRNPLIGMAIYRSVRAGSAWRAPELAIRGLVGDPSSRPTVNCCILCTCCRMPAATTTPTSGVAGALQSDAQGH